MAHHKSAYKRIKTSERNRIRNRYNRSSMKTRIKDLMKADSREESIDKLNQAVSTIDKLVKKGIIHKNTAANKKSRLMKHVNSLT
jgi:small subunit ribosomal protein S20